MSSDDDMKLPEGKTCGDCHYYRFCCGFFMCPQQNTKCDWSPSKYVGREEDTTNG